MSKTELAKILYALQIAYGKEKAIKIFEKMIKLIVS